MVKCKFETVGKKQGRKATSILRLYAYTIILQLSNASLQKLFLYKSMTLLNVKYYSM